MSYHKDIGIELIEKLYDYAEGATWYLQLSMNEAFALTPYLCFGKKE